MDLSPLLQSLSSVEKRYGRSIVDIRRQMVIWEEMLSGEELFLPPFVVDTAGHFSCRYISLPQPREFSSVFDLMKLLSTYRKYNVSVGIDLTNVGFSKSEWISFLMLLEATIVDWRRVWITVNALTENGLALLEVLRGRKANYLNLNLLVSEELFSLGPDDEVSVPGKEITEIKKLRIRDFHLLFDSVRRSGVGMRFIFPGIKQLQDAPALGSRRIGLEGGVLLYPGEAVPSGRVNLLRFLKRGSVGWDFDWERLSDRIEHSVRLLDDLIDLNEFYPAEISSNVKRLRRIHLGFAGWAQCLCYLGIPYDSDAAIVLGKKLAKFISDTAHKASWQLAKERGVFPAYRSSLLEERHLKRRNISILSGLGQIEEEEAGGVCPQNSILDGKAQGVFALFDEVSRQRGFYSEELVAFLRKNTSVQGLEYVPEDVKRIFVVAGDVGLDWWYKMQSVFQEHWDGLVDISLRGSALDVDGLKKAVLFDAVAVRFFPMQVSFENEERQEKKQAVEFDGLLTLPLKERPEVLFGSTIKVATACGNLLVTINQDGGGNLREILLRLEKAGGCVSSHLETMGKLLSICLTKDVALSEIVDALKEINCSSVGWNNGRRVFSCADAVAQVLEKKISSDRQASRETGTVSLDESDISIWN